MKEETSNAVKSPSTKTSSHAAKRSPRCATAVDAVAATEPNKRESFLDQTVHDLQDAFNSLQFWAGGVSVSRDFDDETAEKQHRLQSLNDIVLAPCKCQNYTEVVEGKDKQALQQRQEDQFLSAEWRTSESSRKSGAKQQQRRQPPLSWILSVCTEETFNCHQNASDVVDQFMMLDDQEGFTDDRTLEGLSILNSEEEDEMQMRRLTSWGTIGTGGSIGTCESSTSLITEAERDGSPCLDDDGNPINPALLEKTIAASQKRRPKRNRLVKFDYPPVSSFRQCERIEQADLDKLFFTEEELDQYELDRYETAVADDVEVVAIAPSPEEGGMLETNDTKASGTPTSDTSNNSNKFSSLYVPTPRIKDGARSGRRPGTPGRNRFPFENVAARNAERKKLLAGAMADKKQMSPAHHQQHQQRQQHQQPVDHCESISSPSSSAVKSPRSARLVKSVQIFLRERSTGSRTEEH